MRAYPRRRLPPLAWLVMTCAACAHVDRHEVETLAAALQLEPGDTVADIGAGDGGFSRAVAEIVGAKGHVYATEIDTDRLDDLRQIARDTENYSVIVVSDAQTGLQESCCDAIYMRHVYHHLPQPRATLASIYTALKPGGRFVVVDFKPTLLLALSTPEGIPEDRGGHGICSQLVIKEAQEAGFVLSEQVEEWPGPFLLDTYALVFHKPAAQPPTP